MRYIMCVIYGSAPGGPLLKLRPLLAHTFNINDEMIKKKKERRIYYDMTEKNIIPIIDHYYFTKKYITKI